MTVGAVKILVRHLTSAQVKALSTPVTLLAGVAGSLYWPSRIGLYSHAGTIPYSGNGAGLKVGWPGGPEPFSTSLGLLEQATDIWETQAATNHDGATLVGAPLILYATANPTLGNGTLDIIVEYRKVTV